MAGIPTNFSAISNVLANYNFVDIASGTGYINFYVGKTNTNNLLSNFSFYSDTILTAVNDIIANQSELLVIDDDFDVLLNRPLDVRGLAIINLPLESISGTRISSCKAKVVVSKWDGVTETVLVTSGFSRAISASIGTTVYTMTAINVNIPLTHFKIGEYLRFTVKIYANTDGGGAGAGVGYAHDPKSRITGWDSTSAVPSQLIFQCPVRLNL